MNPDPAIAGPAVEHWPEYANLSSCYREKEVLVTGGLGFVGSHLAAALVGLGASITIVDLDCAVSRPSLLNISGLTSLNAVRLRKLDVSDPVALDELFADEPFDAVFHLAAYSVIEQSAQDPRMSMITNAVGVASLLTSILHSPIQRPFSIVTVSTDKVYGESGREATNETAALGGRGVYEAGKIAGDILARTFYDLHGLPISVVRPCNIFGPCDFSQSRLIPRAFSAIYGRPEPRPPELYRSSIQHSRSYVYVEDAVRMILSVGAEPSCTGDAFNLPGCISTSTPLILQSLIDAASRFEQPFDRLRASQIQQNGINIVSHTGGILVTPIVRQEIDGRKLVERTGAAPTVGFEEGLRRTITAYRQYYVGGGEWLLGGAAGLVS